MKIFIENDPVFFPELKYTFSIFALNKGLSIEFVNSSEIADLLVMSTPSSGLLISKEFFVKLSQRKINQFEIFESQVIVNNSDGSPDYLSTCFYLLSCCQELVVAIHDEFGRFRFQDSLQNRFNCAQDNLVQIYFDKLVEQLKIKSNKVKSTSRIFLSHDIDSIHGSLLQDGFYTARNLQFRQFVNVVLTNLFSKPRWFNIDRIMKIESDYEFKSTFFWLVNKGKVDGLMSNSDYNILNKKISSTIKNVDKKGWENGLHKSATSNSFEEELKKLPVDVIANRYHYLKFNPHIDFKQIEKAGIKFDSSLGFAETFGFRNNFASPVRPFNFDERRSFEFIEVPMNVMDTTFYNYLKVSATEFATASIDFFEKNKEGNILSLLIHNNFISDYKYSKYLEAFKKILAYLYESKFTSINQIEILKEYYHEY